MMRGWLVLGGSLFGLFVTFLVMAAPDLPFMVEPRTGFGAGE